MKITGCEVLTLPDHGDGHHEGEIARWLVAVGQEVAEDDPLVEIQTDKTTVEIPSPAAGKVKTQAARIDFATPQRTAENRLVAPTPMIAEVIVWVVEIGASQPSAVV
jgi:hypothetical protein